MTSEGTVISLPSYLLFCWLFSTSDILKFFGKIVFLGVLLSTSSMAGSSAYNPARSAETDPSYVVNYDFLLEIGTRYKEAAIFAHENVCFSSSVLAYSRGFTTL